MSAHQLMLAEWAIDPRDCWATPQIIVDSLNEEGRFTVDACAEPRTAKLPKFWTPAEDGLAQDWRDERVFCNPTYSDVWPWLEKCIEARLAAFLVPVASDAAWYHRALRHASLIDFFKGRIDFEPPPGIIASTCNGRHCVMWFGEVWRDPSMRWRSRDAKTGRLIA